MSRARQGYLALAALLVAGVVLIAVELSNGARDHGESTAADPCADRQPFPGDGFEATLQRIALDGLDGAACELGTTREELVLSFDSQLGDDVEWDEETLEQALRSGLEEAIDDAEARDSLGSIEATILRELVSRAPLDWLIEGGGDLADLFGGIFDRR
jgi:hypothetical protein